MVQLSGKKEIISKFARHESDSGSSEVQIAILSRKILDLTEHFKIHAKDHHSRTGLMKMVSKRRGLLKYLKLTDADKYKKVIGELGLRK